MLSFLSLSEDINLGTNGPSGNLWQLGLDVIGKATKLFDVHGSSGSKVLVEVFNERLPDDYVLSFWLKWLKTWRIS